ncbi:subfamily F2 cell envelope-associated transcriptional attenuator [Lacticaseibacillus casei A2-362]|nr:subfamily F2 cell envelope-associated transcriptional attenuator [Lacticaseibacillus casei A2-362]
MAKEHPDDPLSSLVQPQHHHHHHHHGHHHNREFHLWRWLAGFALLVILAVAGVAAYAYHELHTTVDHTYIPLPKQQQSDATLKKTKPISILLMGTDTGAFGRTEKNGRSDTMIVATLNPGNKTTTMISVPRDTMAQMMGDKGINIQKVNAAYSIGGATMAVDTTSALLGVPINYYAVINMGGLEKIIDALGGVTIIPSLTFNNTGYSFTQGKSTKMDGQKALAYIRMRYNDPHGDYGRQDRERQVITAVIKAAPSLSNVTKFTELLKQVEGNFRTNLTFDNLVNLYRHYRAAGQNVKQDHLQGVGAYLNGSSYQIAPTSELQRVSDLINQNLDRPSKKLNNEETRQNALNPNFDWTATNSKVKYKVQGADQVN